MSNDQKPERVRAVAAGSSGPGDAAGAGVEVRDGSSGAASVLAETAERSTAGGPSLAAIFLFLLGCGAGGAAIAALPHFVGAR